MISPGRTKFRVPGWGYAHFSGRVSCWRVMWV
jgi:hypothetical protein